MLSSFKLAYHLGFDFAENDSCFRLTVPLLGPAKLGGAVAVFRNPSLVQCLRYPFVPLRPFLFDFLSNERALKRATFVKGRIHPRKQPFRSLDTLHSTK